MDILLQQIINGLVQGSVYALVALGYTMVYGILGLINFAHGEVVMIGAMVALTASQILLALGLPPFLVLLLSLFIAVTVCMVLGYGIERIAYRRLRNAPRLAPLITAIGVSIVLQNLAMIFWGREYHAFPSLLPNGSHDFGGAIINEVQIIIVLVALAMMAGLLLLVHRTRLGRAMRAVAKGWNMHGEPITVEGTELLARALQHETDHLSGILYTDKATSISDDTDKDSPDEDQENYE